MSTLLYVAFSRLGLSGKYARSNYEWSYPSVLTCHSAYRHTSPHVLSHVNNHIMRGGTNAFSLSQWRKWLVDKLPPTTATEAVIFVSAQSPRALSPATTRPPLQAFDQR